MSLQTFGACLPNGFRSGAVRDRLNLVFVRYYRANLIGHYLSDVTTVFEDRNRFAICLETDPST